MENGGTEEDGTEDYDYESSSACLDEYGWDPSVDAYLEEVVEEAPHLPNGLIDFAWVSCTFLETLAPDEDQVESALERFSPAALQERYLYLRSGRGSDCILGESPTEEENVTSDALGTTARLADEPSDLSRTRGVGPPGRDRVLDAMQNFLFGRPRPQPQPAEDPKSPPSLATSSSAQPAEDPKPPPSLATSSSAPSPPPTLPQPQLADNPKQSPTSASSSSAASPPPAPSSATAKDPSTKAAVPAPVDAPAEVHAHGPPNTTSEDLSVASCTNEALRSCLEELRWHGEALRRCAAGAEASSLAAEASQRRKALLWRLGFGPIEATTVANRSVAE